SRSGERPMATDTAQQEASKLSLPALTAMVVGSMVGAGVFQLPARFAGETGGYGALIAWTVAGLGMLMLAFVFPDAGRPQARPRQRRLRLRPRRVRPLPRVPVGGGVLGLGVCRQRVLLGAHQQHRVAALPRAGAGARAGRHL